MKILGVTLPVPKVYAERIYYKRKKVFVGKNFFRKVHKGRKFVLYESRGIGAYTGWADIKFVGNMETTSISRKYGKKLMISNNELIEYSKGRNEMFVIEFENFEKFNNPVKPKRFVTIGGKYIYEDEFEMIKKTKG